MAFHAAGCEVPKLSMNCCVLNSSGTFYHLLMALHHALIGQRNHGQSSAHTRTEVTLVHLAVQGIRRTRIDEVL